MKKAIVIVPAHNEQEHIEKCVSGLKSQTYPTDVLVSCDRCTDDTEKIAQSCGAITIQTINNTGMRSGAINQGLNKILNNPDYAYVLAMDADSWCMPNMIEEGIKVLESNSKLAGVCSRAGVIKPKNPGLVENILYHLQNIEYGEYDASRIECGDMIKVLHGLATLFRIEVLRELREERGYIYDESALVEDYALTLDLKKRGYKATTSMNMIAFTEVPNTVMSLWKQRNRWLLGGLDILKIHGINKYTYWDILNQVAFIIFMSFNLILVALLLMSNHVVYSSFILLIYGAAYLDSLYRLKYVQNITLTDILIKVLFVPYFLYGFFHMASQINAYKSYLMRAKREYEN
jgi:cellulose synthase/poly-beta-1,6-N-acetylglucosamine synthase-like glycosyltransferase